mmetsp:Transcript_25415/g.82152  ORF Transcript_25415/g.82152 Transcript_25415/m.82152 type:complete len:222 (-) Transcript_25415:153-818(-)
MGPAALPHDCARRVTLTLHGVAAHPPQLLHRQLLTTGECGQRRRLRLLSDAPQLSGLRRQRHEERLRRARQPSLRQRVRLRSAGGGRVRSAAGARRLFLQQQRGHDGHGRWRLRVRRPSQDSGARQRLLHSHRQGDRVQAGAGRLAGGRQRPGIARGHDAGGRGHSGMGAPHARLLRAAVKGGGKQSRARSKAMAVSLRLILGPGRNAGPGAIANGCWCSR